MVGSVYLSVILVKVNESCTLKHLEYIKPSLITSDLLTWTVGTINYPSGRLINSFHYLTICFGCHDWVNILFIQGAAGSPSSVTHGFLPLPGYCRPTTRGDSCKSQHCFNTIQMWIFLIPLWTLRRRFMHKVSVLQDSVVQQGNCIWDVLHGGNPRAVQKSCYTFAGLACWRHLYL